MFYDEENRTHKISVEEIDIAANGDTKEDALSLLAINLQEYADEYYSEFEYWYSAPNRKAHLPYVLKIFLQSNIKNIIKMIECQAGKI